MLYKIPVKPVNYERVVTGERKLEA